MGILLGGGGGGGGGVVGRVGTCIHEHCRGGRKGLRYWVIFGAVLQ